MKEVGTTSWSSPNIDATNTSLFTGLPGGGRANSGYYFSDGGSGYWWSSSEYDPGSAWLRGLSYLYGGASRYYNLKGNGYSVRCLSD
jgi:uncharacterized protein (TIGR02145 family)